MGVGGMLSHLSSGSGKEDGSRSGGSAPDNGAGVVGVGLLPQRSTPLVNRLGFIVDDIGKGSSVRRKRGGEPPLSPASGAQRM